jgi:predicted RNase H-like nuclease (RuvC/YqgF family)
LSLSLKKANITPVQCSTGFRVAKIMERLGLTEDQFESFMSDIYDRCQKLELGPDQIEKYLTETINISKIVFPSQIPNYIHTKINEIEELEKQKKNKYETISELNKEILTLKKNKSH